MERDFLKRFASLCWVEMILLYSAFKDNPWGHGGERRSAQIVSILREQGLAFQPLKGQPEVGRESPADRRGTGRAIARYLNVPWSRRKAYLSNKTILMHRYQEVFEAHPCGLLLWEPWSSQEYWVPFLARNAGWRVIALPHNLESLLTPDRTSNISGRYSPDWFDEEREALALCDHVVTISREEQWLLRLYGIEADFLPYYPVQQVAASLQAIRKRRLTRTNVRTPRRFLLLGTYNNPATGLGMVEIVRAFSVLAADVELHVAGYRTETLKDDIAIPDGVVLHGAVEQSRLDDLLATVDGMIIHQSPTTGCLTRIPEMLIAGLPLLMNANAARSWFNYPGVHVYETFEELFAGVADNFDVPECPERPLDAETRFIKTVVELNEAMG